MPHRNPARFCTAFAAGLGALLCAAAPSLASDRITTLHAFGGTGYDPRAGIVADADGNLLGTTVAGGTGCTAGAGCGTVFRLVPPQAAGQDWQYQTLYNFQGGADGYFAVAPLTPSPDGAVYGYTSAGSNGNVFRLLPPAGAGTGWTFEILYVFQGGQDGDLLSVAAPLILDQGSLYGIASGGASSACGTGGCGSVFRLDPGAAGQPWSKQTLVEFSGGATGGVPDSIAGLDPSGSVFVALTHDKGAVAQVSPTASGWTETVIANFAGGADGRAPGNLLLPADGAVYGLAAATRKTCGLVFQLTPPAAGGGWTRSVVAYVKDHGWAPVSLAPGGGGTLIGAIEGDFDFFAGSLYRLTPPAMAGPWTFTELWNFDRGPDRNPLNAIVGRGGNIFSVLNGGDSSSGSVVELRTAPLR